ncbi:MAG: hypothetical protein U0X93_08275 [Anaerolineales bacterium]
MSNLFVRKATAMVMFVVAFSTFIYAVLRSTGDAGISTVSARCITLADMDIPALIVSAAFIIFEVVVYASSLIAVMPRSGGDYVWQTRIWRRIMDSSDHHCVHAWLYLHLWRHAPADRDHSIAGASGLQSAAVVCRQGNALFVCSLLTLGFLLVIFLGMKNYARAQKYSFYAVCLGC